MILVDFYRLMKYKLGNSYFSRFFMQLLRNKRGTFSISPTNVVDLLYNVNKYNSNFGGEKYEEMH